MAASLHGKIHQPSRSLPRRRWLQAAPEPRWIHGLLLVGYVLFGYEISDIKNIPPADIHYAVGHVDASGQLTSGGMTPLSQAEAAARYPRALSAAKPIDQLVN